MGLVLGHIFQCLQTYGMRAAVMCLLLLKTPKGLPSLVGQLNNRERNKERM